MEFKFGKKQAQQNNQESENTLPWDEVAVALVQDVKDVDKTFIGLQKQYKKYKGMMSLLYKYYLLELEEGTIHDNHSIATEDKKYKYIFFSVPYENKFYFIIYPLEIEDDIIDKIKQRVNELSIPPKEVEIEEIKARVASISSSKSKDLINIGIIVVSLAVGSFVMYNVFIKKKEVKMPAVVHGPMPVATKPSQPQPPPQLSPIQEHYALALAEAKCFLDLDKKLSELQKSGVRVSSVSVNTSSTPQGATCSYTIGEEYTYPAVGTQLNGKYYVKDENKTVNISYQDFVKMQDQIPALLKYTDFLKCLQFMKNNNFVLNSRPALLQANFSISQTSNSSVNLYNTGKFLYGLESVCGYNLNINNFSFSKGSISGTFMLNWSSEPQESSTPVNNSTAAVQPAKYQQPTTPIQPQANAPGKPSAPPKIVISMQPVKTTTQSGNR